MQARLHPSTRGWTSPATTERERVSSPTPAPVTPEIGPAGGTRAPGTPRRTALHVRVVKVLKAVVFLLALVPFVTLLQGAFTDTLGANPIEALQLDTGHWALRFLLLTLAVTPVRRVTGWSALVGWRRMLGLFAFFYATLHFIVYAVLDQALDLGAVVADVAEHPYVTIGFAAWLLLVPLAVTSTKGWIRRLGSARWVALHRLVYVCAMGGAVHYLWAVKKDVREPLVYLGILAILLGWRLVASRLLRKAAA